MIDQLEAIHCGGGIEGMNALTARSANHRYFAIPDSESNLLKMSHRRCQPAAISPNAISPAGYTRLMSRSGDIAGLVETDTFTSQRRCPGSSDGSKRWSEILIHKIRSSFQTCTRSVREVLQTRTRSESPGGILTRNACCLVAISLIFAGVAA